MKVPRTTKKYHLLAIAFLVFLNLTLATFFVFLTSAPQKQHNNQLLPFTKDMVEKEAQKLAGKDILFKDLTIFFQALATNRGAVFAYEVLKIAPIPPNTDMHLLGHVVGDELYKQQGLAGITVCTQDFRNACSHSIVVGYLLANGEAGLPEIARTCQQAPGGKGAYTMCFHGLGHGVLAFTGYDLEKAVTLCQKTNTQASQNKEAPECIGGGIMEMISGGDHNKTLWATQAQKLFKEEDPLFPCNAQFIPNDAKPICYIYITPHLFEAAGGSLNSQTEKDFAKAFTFCSKIPTEETVNRASCFGGFGKEFVVLASNHDIRDVGAMTDKQLKTVYDWCLFTSDVPGVGDCIGQALQSLYWGGENSYDAALRLCNLANNTPYEQRCYAELINAVKVYSANQKALKTFCTQVPKSYSETCI